MKLLSLTGVLSLSLLFSWPAVAEVGVDVRLPGVSIYIGDRNRDGYYWDGDRWREPSWWRDNCYRFEGRKNFRGSCGAPPRGPKHCPPGQAKKGNC
jgi:hypothetical protein